MRQLNTIENDASCVLVKLWMRRVRCVTKSMLNLDDGTIQDVEYKDCRVNLADQILPEVLLVQKFFVLAEYLSFVICVWLRYIP